ncbi:hypothetical protein PYW08_008402 [Mythimna loreyi]|uniref:Uncharacterized protein n=1 Tax=Mythimna loreyi TaxID=667449 RepID=A0ACC2QDZ9_9NEOP|nr:hypothetical protein PYW08_008402 [Mythimna loreyi]
MCRAVCVLGLLALCVGITHSWDFAVSLRNHIIFFTNGTISNDVLLFNQNPTALVYDETQDRILYINKQSNDDVICGLYIITRDHKCFTERKGYNIHSFAFDPVTETIFFTETRTNNIYMISLNFSFTGIVYALDNVTPADIVVDSCQGYIYWVNKLINGNRKLLERGRFNSTGREVILKSGYFQIHDLAIDLHTQNLYYFDEFDGFGYINSLDFGAKETSLLELHAPSTILTVSKDYIYFTRSNESEDTVWQLPKSARLHIIHPELVKKMDNVKILGIVANYKLVDQIKGIQGCESLTSLLSKPVVPASVDEQLNITVSKNNSQHSNYSFNDEELPKSR